MKNYIVLFELYGKKLKTRVEANSPKEAEEIIKNKIIFHKVKEEDIFDIMNDINKIIK